MAAIVVERIRKTFQVKQKAAGLRHSLSALVRPRYREVTAVRDISFEMQEGELLGFIGPNGAGKSTTIKMLTGILHPTSGSARVLGLVPWEQRTALAYRIGTVFGQRPQLWYHLPTIDTLYLFGRIYDLDDAQIRRRIAMLTEAFDLGELLETPVRKLSLGQRMRCEVAASFIHQPQLLLLDEPSIGLDVVARQNIRAVIRRMNAEEGVGIMLTSHDAGDVEALCDRVIIVNHGEIIFQDTVAALKRRYLTSKRIEVHYASEIPADFAFEGAEIVARSACSLTLTFDTRQLPVERVIARLAAATELVDVSITDPALEEVIRAIFEETNAAE